MRAKVLFFLTRSDALGGAAVHVADLSDSLSEIGMKVTVLMGGDGPVRSLFENDAVEVETVPFLNRKVSPAKDLVAFFYIFWRIYREEPDIVSSHTSKVGILVRLACYLLGQTNIFTPHCWSFFQIGKPARAYKLMEIVMTLFSSIIVCVSRDEKKAIESERLMSRARVMVIHNGMKVVREPKDPSDDKELNFVQIARFEEQKDFDTLFSAIDLLRDRPFVVHLIGEGSLRDEALQKIEQMDLGDKVIFYGQRRDVENFLLRGRVYLLSTHWEGLPRSIIEAMGAGMPIIATRVGGIPELVSEGRTGHMFMPEDSQALARCMDRYLSNPKLILQFGKRSRETFRRKFTYDHMLANYLLLYDALLDHEV